ncbi:MAG: tetratricopeptide repeat protein [Thermoanaerobaculia bacterium]
MNRDHALFLIIGILGGFLAGYVLQEELAARQPQRVIAGSVAPGGGPAAGGAPSGAAPMAEIERLKKRIDADPNDGQAILELANLNFDIQNWPRAIELYERLLVLRPGDADVLTDLGICLRAQRDFDGALARFREAERVAPDHWQARFNELVVLAIDLGDFETAVGKLGELEALAPGNADVARLAEEIRRRRTAS